MRANKFLRFNLIKFQRYILGKKFLPILKGPLKGYLWSTGSSYDYLTGEYEDPKLIETFFSFVKPDTVFYDLGANVGFYTFLAEQRISTGLIYSFEPVPAIGGIFNQHLALNNNRINREHISFHPFAISNAEKEVIFSNDLHTREGNTYMAETARFKNAADTLTVKSYSIDGLIKKGFKLPDIIKIDVEGAELEVLEGARQTISSAKPHILLGTHDCHVPGIKDKCVDLLQSLGYHLQHTGYYNKHTAGHDDFIAIHQDKLYDKGR